MQPVPSRLLRCGTAALPLHCPRQAIPPMRRGLIMRWTRRVSSSCCLGFSLLLLTFVTAGEKGTPGLGNKGPLTPREEMATFKVPKGFKVELVAGEQDSVDPVAM